MHTLRDAAAPVPIRQPTFTHKIQPGGNEANEMQPVNMFYSIEWEKQRGTSGTFFVWVRHYKVVTYWRSATIHFQSLLHRDLSGTEE